MAVNYTMAQASKIIAEGTDKEAIFDIGRRFPLLLNSVSKISALAGKEFVEFMSYLPDYITANKVNSAMKSVLDSGESEAGEETNSEATTEEKEPEKKKTSKKSKKETVEEEADAGDDVIDNVEWDESMNAKQLWEILGKHNKRKLAKSTKKADLVDACRKAFGEPKTDESEEDAVEENDDETSENPYEGKSAMELFKECKKRGLKPASKKPAKFYAELLTKDDEAKAQSNDEEEDDWDDEEEEVTPAPKSKRAKGGKTEKKAEKKTEKVEDDDDDDDDDEWDL